MKPKNIKFSKHIIQKISEVNGSTMDKKINNLIDIVEPVMPFVEYTNEQSSMKVYQDTLERIDIFRITSSESRENILTRMLLVLAELDNLSDGEKWISFKLTNPYNNLLVIDGQMEYSSKELSFNYRGNLFRGKLPPTYVADGKDLTKELYLWYDNLNWSEIVELIYENADNPKEINKGGYILEVNCS